MKFLARAERYQTLMRDTVERLDLENVNAIDGRSVGELADTVLAAVNMQETNGRFGRRTVNSL